MSYRTVKRLLGETSLERKCRFLFGGGLLLLISGSFYVYAYMTTKLVYEENYKQAQKLVYPFLLEKHAIGLEPSDSKRAIKEMISELQESVATPEQRAAANQAASRIPGGRPSGLEYTGYRFLKPLRHDVATPEGEYRTSELEDYDALDMIENGAPDFHRTVNERGGEFQYFRAIRAQKICVQCHRDSGMVPADANLKEGGLMSVVKITMPLDATRRALAWNNAILLATAVGTAFLAMLAAYAIVRYVIVKPVLHLKDVSDQIARGNLEQRADIRTGDEFEELSHAFNRMLRHLVTVQDELRAVNADLDGKVDQLAQVNLRLYELNKLKDDFLATMSHELRTPLNSILGFSDVLARADNLQDKQKRFLRNIQTSGNALMVMINDLLDLAKIESGRMELQIVECSVADLVERQVASLNPLAEKKNIDLTYEIDPELPMLLQDPIKIQQILNNLLSNAIKFTPEGGRVRVRARRASDAIFELVVEDTGIGIPLNEQATIFEKFRQGQTIPGQRDAMTREYGGTGLGLSIVKELSKLLGGEVALVSEFGRGSTFTVRLPVRFEGRPLARSELLTPPPITSSRLTRKILEPATENGDSSQPSISQPGVPAPPGLGASPAPSTAMANIAGESRVPPANVNSDETAA